MQGSNPPIGKSVSQRPAYLKNKKGDKIGAMSFFKSGRFDNFLNNSAKGEQKGASGSDTIRAAIKAAFNELGEEAAGKGHEFRGINLTRRAHSINGRAKEKVNDGIQSVHKVLEASNETGKQYLMLQMKMQHMSLSMSTISHMMKARNEATRNAIKGVQ